MPRPTSVSIGTVAALIAVIPFIVGACGPDVRDPEVFAEEIVPLREEWLEMCQQACMKSDASVACGPFPGDPFTCERFDPINAVRCYTAYEKAIRRKECTDDTRSVKTIVERCDDVWDPCPDLGGTGGTNGTAGGTESGAGDSEGSDTGGPS